MFLKPMSPQDIEEDSCKEIQEQLAKNILKLMMSKHCLGRRETSDV